MVTRSFRAFAVSVCAMLFWGCGAACAQSLLTLSDAATSVNAWPALRILPDPSGVMKPEQALAAITKFAPPTTAPSTLGVNATAMWIALPVQVDPQSDGRWVLDINYPPIQFVDFYLFENAVRIESAQAGSLRAFDARPLRSRTHAWPLQLSAGKQYVVLVRLETSGSMIAPITFNKPAAFHSTATREQMLQGLLGGIALCLLLYSLAQWLYLREPLFAKYAILISGSMMFSALQFGIGKQFLWTHSNWLEQHAAGISSLLALCGSFLFTEQVLAEAGRKSKLSMVLRVGAWVTFVLGIVYCFDLINNRAITAFITIFGIAPSVLGLPKAALRAWNGDRVGIALTFAWLTYIIATLIIVGVIRGSIPATFWTQHAFQIGATLDMLAFMYVLGQRTKSVRMVAQRASLERDALRSLAITDPLTGLVNRRGLMEILDTAAIRATSANLLAVYMIDVDGFKPVNDQYGHDIGDLLLKQIAQRLRMNVRFSDITSRLGGDEFVVLAEGMKSEQQVYELGAKLLAVCNEPFILSEHRVTIGLSIGYAIGPEDSHSAPQLMQMADSAMYAGKRAGKRQLLRAGSRIETPQPPAIQ
jgi:diguanylate cyclase